MSKRSKRRKRKFKKKNNFKRRPKGTNKHHLFPKSRGGSRNPSNLLLINIEKHACWHKIFGLRTLREVIQLLERLDRLKKRSKNEVPSL